MLRLGRKYEIPNFKTMALKRLRRLFPRDLGEWEQIRSELTRLSYQPASKGFAFDVVNAAYQKDSEIPSIFPAAFLFLYMKHSLVCPEPRQFMTCAWSFCEQRPKFYRECRGPISLWQLCSLRQCMQLYLGGQPSWTSGLAYSRSVLKSTKNIGFALPIGFLVHVAYRKNRAWKVWRMSLGD